MSHALVEELTNDQLKKDIPDFKVGDTLKVHTRIIEGSKERTQVFIGTVIARTGGGLSETVSLYRIAYGSGMERVFLIHSPRISQIEVMRSGKVRRSKLYYLRGRFGKASKVKEDLGAFLKKKAAAKIAAASAPQEVAPAKEEIQEEKSE